jgi:hypothetical protein
MAKYTQKIFNGILTGVDKTDMKEENSVDAVNVDISTLGNLQNMQGTEKQITTGLAYQIDCLFRLNGTNFVVYNGIISTL